MIFDDFIAVSKEEKGEATLPQPTVVSVANWKVQFF
jgi:hypothetical protein